MAERNVDLIIKARDQASAAFQSVEKSLASLQSVQEAVSASADLMGRALAGGKDDVAKLTAAFDNKKFTTFAQGFDLAARAVEKAKSKLAEQDAAVLETGERYRALGEQIRAAKRALEALQNREEKTTDNEARIRATSRAITSLSAEYNRVGKTLATQQQQAAETAEQYERLKSAAAATGAAIRQMETEFRAVADADSISRHATRQQAQIDAQAAAAQQATAERARRLGAAFSAAQAQNRGFIASLGVMIRELRKVPPAADASATSLLRAATSTGNLRQALHAFYGDSRRALSLMQRLRGEVLSLTASFVGFYGVFRTGAGFLEAFNNLEAATQRLSAAFDQDYEKVGQEIRRLQGEASRLGISFDVLSDNYSKFLISGQQAGISQAKLETIFRQVTEAGRVLKLSNDQITGTLTALTQIAGKGSVQMEELRQQLGDRLPGAVGLMASALGYAEDELDQFYKDVTNGNIDAETGLVALGQGLEDAYGGQLSDALDTTATKIGALQNLLFQRKLTAANSGFIKGLETALDALNEFLASDEGIALFESMGQAMGRFFELIPGAIENLDKLVLVFKAWATIKIVQTLRSLYAQAMPHLEASFIRGRQAVLAYNSALYAANPAWLAATTAATRFGAVLRGVRTLVIAASTAFRAFWVAIGGPVGAIISVLTFFAVDAIGGVVAGVDDLDAAMTRADDSIGKVAEAFREAAGDAGVFKAKLDEINKIDIELDLKQVETELARLKKKTFKESLFGDEIDKISSNLADSVGPVAFAQFAALRYQFKQGAISAKEFRDGLDSLAKANDDVLNTEGLSEFRDYLDQMAQAEEKVARLEAELAVLNGTATDAQKVLAGVAEEVEDLNDRVDPAEKQMKKFEEALRKLAEHIPELNAQLKTFDALQEIEADFKAAMEAADGFTDATERAAAAQNALDKRRQALGALGVETAFSGGGSVVDKIIGVESGGRANAKNPNSTATGLGQFTEGTWIAQMQKHFPEMLAEMGRSAALALRNDPEMSRKMVELLVEDNARYLGERGHQATDTNLYLAHFLGAGGASKLLSSAPGTPVANILGQDQIAANQSILGGGKTREDVIEWSRRKMGISERELDVVTYLNEKEQDRLELAKDFHDNLRQRIENEEFELSIQDKALQDREVAKALREAELEAEKAGIATKENGFRLTSAERAELEKVTREKFAQQAADEAREEKLKEAAALEEQITLLQERRRFLQEQQTHLEGQGDMAGAARIGEELTDVDAQLTGLIDKAMAFWQALGGDGADAAIQKLQITQAELNRVESTAVTTGEQMNNMIADKFTSAFDSFAQAVANGENAWDAFKTAFLKAASEMLIQIAQMIIRQAILNALTGGQGANGGIGGMLAGGINSFVRHGGGLAGSYGTTRNLNPAIFANAARYHGGGIAGLRPDEVPAVLQRGEEVVTANDPRHRANGGLAPAMPTIINAVDGSDAMEQALATPRGKEAVINYMRANRASIKAVLG